MVLAGSRARHRPLPEADPGGIPLDLAGFFRRRRLDAAATAGPALQQPCAPVTSPNLDDFAFLPVAAGYWRQHELWDGTYTLDDLLDIIELIRVQKANQARAIQARA